MLNEYQKASGKQAYAFYFSIQGYKLVLQVARCRWHNRMYIACALLITRMHTTMFVIVNSADLEFKFMGKRNMNAFYMSVILNKAMRLVIHYK